MGKIYVNQDWRLTLNTGVNLTGATTTNIKAEKPDGTTATFEADILVATDGTIYYDFEGGDDGDLDQAGVWIFWAFVVFADEKQNPGEPIKIKIYAEGD